MHYYENIMITKKIVSIIYSVAVISCVSCNSLAQEETSKKMRFKIMLKMHKMYHNLLGNKFKNRCVFSTKIRSVSRLVNLTKSTFRETLRWGKLNGFRKASW